ncbi:MAG: FAD-dependent oxidoreductase, partial [Microgenomates group bacterium]
VDFSVRPFKLWTALPDSLSPDFFEKASPKEILELTKRIKKELEPACTADSIVVATGATSIMVGVTGEKEFLARGVSTCAVCDAAFFRDKITFVVGGGDSAMEDALALTKFAKSVTIIHRRDSFRASQIMQDRVLAHEKVKVLWNTTLDSVTGNDVVTSITITKNGVQKNMPADGVFIAIGHTPMNQIFQDQLLLDAHGYIVTRQSATKFGVDAAHSALDDADLVLFPTMTSIEGVFAAGDNVDVRYKQAITAAGQGCSAALDAERWLERQ